MSLPLIRYYPLVKYLSQLHRETVQAESVQTLGAAMTLYKMGVGGDISFMEFLEKLGFRSRREAAPVRVTKEEAIAKAEKIHEAVLRSKGRSKGK